MNEGDIIVRVTTGKRYRVTKVYRKSELRSYESYDIEACDSGRKSAITEGTMKSNHGKPPNFRMATEEESNQHGTL